MNRFGPAWPAPSLAEIVELDRLKPHDYIEMADRLNVESASPAAVID